MCIFENNLECVLVIFKLRNFEIFARAKIQSGLDRQNKRKIFALAARSIFKPS